VKDWRPWAGANCTAGDQHPRSPAPARWSN